MIDMDHEESIVRAFILPTRRERYLEFLKSPKNRLKFRRELAHFKALNPKYIVEIVPSHQNPSSLVNILTSKGAPRTCWVMSENSRIDGQELDLEEALEETIGYGMGTFISCVPGKLAFFENEDVRCLLER
jgi:hypothetical protein